MILHYLKLFFENFNSYFIPIFVILDPFAVIPNFLLFTSQDTIEQRNLTRKKAVFLAFCILTLFCLSGMKIFNLFNITLPAFQIGGGILLLINGINQLYANRKKIIEEEKQEAIHKEDVWIFPLGMPLLAGPGSISTVILLSSNTKNSFDMMTLIFAIACACLLALIILKSSFILSKWLGKTGLNLLTRIMGILLTSIAIQFIMNGLSVYIRSFKF